MTPARIGSYRVTRELGQGGMGVVYAAHDDRLDRAVAIKMVRPDLLADPNALARFRREARAAARVSHPHICPLYEFAEADGRPFLVMELLEGESLAARLERGALSTLDALRYGHQMLDALAELHRSGIIHRDLKPANVFLTRHGVKLVDFGLALPVSVEDVTQEASLTAHGAIIGTPRYMAAEQLFGRQADERADVWAAAAVIYEMIAGRPAFDGASLPEIVHAVGYREPAPLGTSGELAAIDRALRPALIKDPAQRLPSIAALGDRLRQAATGAMPAPGAGDSAPGRLPAPHPQVRAAPGRSTRFVALPLRVLRTDPDTDFLAFSVPDAVSSALASLESLVVRTPRASVGADVDVRAIGRDWDVDVVLTGTLLRAGSHVRVSAQLADASDGALIWTEVAQAPLADLFQLQDALTSRIVSSLQLPLTARDRRALEHQVPANADAYALYMRANQLMVEPVTWREARDLYERAVELDPTYAPAWARLGRVRRVLAKFSGESGQLSRAQDAFARAFALDPESSIAHDLAAYVDAELGQAVDGMARLLGKAATRPTDVGLMSGLVTTCRYAGMLDASLAAHARAMAVDAAVRTSVAWTHYMRGEYDLAIASDVGVPPFCAVVSKIITGRLSLDELKTLEDTLHGGARFGAMAYRLFEQGDVAGGLEAVERLEQSGFNDPEGWYLYASRCAFAGGVEPAIALLERAVSGHYGCADALRIHAEWSRLRGHPAFESLVGRTRVLVETARAAYVDAGGPAVLGPLPATRWTIGGASPTR